MSTKLMANLALSAALAVGASTLASQAQAEPGGKMIKCYGVAKAHKNDCGSLKHACQGQSTVDNDVYSWVITPKGLCEKLVGGSTEPAAE